MKQIEELYLSYAKTVYKYLLCLAKNKDIAEEQKDIERKKTFVINLNNNSIIFLDSFIDSNLQATGDEIINYINSMVENKGIFYESSNIDDVYYIGKNSDDKLLIWQDGMELEEYPY